MFKEIEMLLTADEIYEMYSEPSSDAEMVAFARAVERVVIEKLCSGVSMPEPASSFHVTPLYEPAQIAAYGAAQRLKALEDAATEAERMTMYPGGRQEAPAHDTVWHAARAIRALRGEA